MKLSTTVLATAGLLLGGTLAVELLGGSESTAAPAGRRAQLHRGRPGSPGRGTDPAVRLGGGRRPHPGPLSAQYSGGNAANMSLVTATALSELPPLTSNVANAMSPRYPTNQECEPPSTSASPVLP